MGTTFRPYQPDQMQLLPQDFLPCAALPSCQRP